MLREVDYAEFVRGRKRLNKDGHLITEDSVLPTTAPGGAPEQNRCYQTPAYLFVLPLAPASLARSAHLAPLTSLRPRRGLARWLLLWSWTLQTYACNIRL